MTDRFFINSLGHHGDGVANTPDGDVFVPFALPGEIVEGIVVQGRLTDVRIIEPVSDRIKPMCRHFKSCGGCALQHAKPEFLARWKQEQVEKVLKSEGLETGFKPIKVSKPHSRRRATFAARRTKKSVIVGFHGRKSETLVEISECALIRPEILSGLGVCRELVKLGGTRKGELRISVTHSENGLDIDVREAKQADGALRAELGAMASRHNLARLSWNLEIMAERQPPIQHFGPAAVSPPVGAFLQATKSGEETLLNAVKQALGQASRIADLFAGCGTLALPLAQQAEVHAVENDAAMLRALDIAWRHTTGLKPVSTEVRDLYRRPMLPIELQKLDAVVLDPPRAGARAQCEQLAQTNVPRIAFVSCNPATFARDARILVKGDYRLDWVQVVDQFLWSGHIELVGQFTKNR